LVIIGRGRAIYAIDDFPQDDLLWRIEWIGGVSYNAKVPSDPQIDVCRLLLRCGLASLTGIRSTPRLPGSRPMIASKPGIIINDVSSATPLNRATWKEFE
jgi:hypothetical protein